MEHLLTMSTGIPWCEYANCASRDALGMMFAPGRNDVVDYYFGNSVTGVSEKNPLSKPGDRYIYSAGNAALVQAVMKQVLGADYPDYPYNRILKKLDVSKDDFTFDQDEKGVYLGGSGLYLTLPVMAKLGLTLLNKGAYGEHQIASPQYVTQMTTQILTPLSNSPDSDLKRWEGPTGMGVWLNKDDDRTIPSFMPDVPDNMFYASGAQGKRLMMFPENGDDGLLVARIGVENNFSAFWQPYSKKLYACLGHHPERTPHNKGTQVGISPGTVPPLVSTPEQSLNAELNFINTNLPIQLLATEMCNCAFITDFAEYKKDSNGGVSIDQEKTIAKCQNVVGADFSVVPLFYRPALSSSTVKISDDGKVQTVEVRLNTTFFTSYKAKVTVLRTSSGQKTCDFAKNVDLPRDTWTSPGVLTRLEGALNFLH